MSFNISKIFIFNYRNLEFVIWFYIADSGFFIIIIVIYGDKKVIYVIKYRILTETCRISIKKYNSKSS